MHDHFDGAHPNLRGTYLAPGVVYLSVYATAIDTLTYRYFGELPDEAAYLRGVAPKVVADFVV